MTEAEIINGLTEIFRDVFGDDTIELQPTMDATCIPGWDSFTHLNIIVATESRFNFAAHSGEIESLNNVGDLVALVARKTTKTG